MHFVIRVEGKNFSEILLLQLRILRLTGKVGSVLVPAKKID
jgi:hypothetical protein